jgi:hypothetical protein
MAHCGNDLIPWSHHAETRMGYSFVGSLVLHGGARFEILRLVSALDLGVTQAATKNEPLPPASPR